MKDDLTKYSLDEVISFCRICRVIIVTRAETLDFLLNSDKEKKDIVYEIRTLRVEHACADAELDYGKNRKGYVYQFKKLVFERYWCYIKIKIKDSNGKIVVVLSFHEEDCNYEKN